MPRLIAWPNGIRIVSRDVLTGPRVTSGGGRESLTGFSQSIASPYGAWRFQFTLPRLRGQAVRRWRGFITALHGGANAASVKICDPDGMSMPDAGADYTQNQIREGLPWSSMLPWSNMRNWAASRPLVRVYSPANKGDSIVYLSEQFWRGNLGCGDQIGFTPYHFGLYIVTEIMPDGGFRIWPPLRKNITEHDFSTLSPMLAMRLESEAAAPMSRGAAGMESPVITMTEVPDETIRAYYEG